MEQQTDYGDFWVDESRIKASPGTKAYYLERFISRYGPDGCSRKEILEGFCTYGGYSVGYVSSLLSNLLRRGSVANYDRGQYVSLAIRFPGDGLDED